MKQAILITAYKNFDHLSSIINFFDEDFIFYIHIDKKSKIDQGLLNKLTSEKKVALISRRFTINWGGINHLKSILWLSEQALKSKEIDYFHLISGQDFPVKSPASFNFFFDNNKEKSFIEFFKVPNKNWEANGGLDRINFYSFFDQLDAKKSRKLINRIIQLQKRLKFRRVYPKTLPPLYAGSTWWSMPRKTLQYVTDFTRVHNKLIKRLKYTFCSEEFYFQTVVLNSPFAVTVMNENLRYINWTPKGENLPNVLDMSDWESIYNSNAFFARKFDSPVSDALKEQIQNQIKNSNYPVA